MATLTSSTRWHHRQVWHTTTIILWMIVACPAGADGLHCFEVKGTFNPTTKKLTAPPADFTAAAAAAGDGATAMEVDGQAAAAAGGQQQQQQLDASLAMSSMDIFAGCGGLSEGMHQVGMWVRVLTQRRLNEDVNVRLSPGIAGHAVD
jgi:hypothetical protein